MEDSFNLKCVAVASAKRLNNKKYGLFLFACFFLFDGLWVFVIKFKFFRPPLIHAVCTLSWPLIILLTELIIVVKRITVHEQILEQNWISCYICSAFDKTMTKSILT